MGNSSQKPQPKYLQLKEALIHYLSDEHYKADQKLPTEHELIEQFNVSRGTIRQALAQLVNEGVLYKIQGSGTFFSGKLSNASPSSSLIGVISPLITTYIFPQIIQGITDIAQQRGYNIVLATSQTNPGKELGCIEQLEAKGIEGLLFDPAFDFQGAPDEELLSFLKNLAIPVVFMGTMIDDRDVSFVSLDDKDAGFKATSYLIESGHRRIACIYPMSLISGVHRYQGYRNALNAHEIPFDRRLDKTINARDTHEAHVSLLIRELLDLGKECPTAILFYNDLLAVEGCRLLEAAGLHVPENISVIGFDDSELVLQSRTPLTSVIHPKYYLGKWAAELLFEQIAHQELHFPRRLIITPEIAFRDSVKPVVD